MEVLRIPGLISLVFGFYCFVLPHTPAVGAASATAAPKKSAFVETMELMKDRSFTILLLVSGFFGFALYYYFQCEGRFLPAVGSNSNNVGTQMIIGQIGEMTSMALVPFFVSRLGMKWTMTLGGLAYVAMFALNMLGQPWALMVGANILHGFCFGFLFVVAQMYVDKAAKPISRRRPRACLSSSSTDSSTSWGTWARATFATSCCPTGPPSGQFRWPSRSSSCSSSWPSSARKQSPGASPRPSPPRSERGSGASCSIRRQQSLADQEAVRHGLR